METEYGTIEGSRAEPASCRTRSFEGFPRDPIQCLSFFSTDATPFFPRFFSSFPRFSSPRHRPRCRLQKITEPNQFNPALPNWEFYIPVDAVVNPPLINQVKPPPDQQVSDKSIMYSIGATLTSKPLATITLARDP